MTGQLWDVVGGGDKGGIVVRVGQDVASDMAPSRLATGALVQEISLVGDRLNYKKLEGAGPDLGWVSIALKDGKPLMAKRQPAADTMPWPRPLDPVVGRKIRILAMHSTAGNSNIMKFQVAQLRQAMGKDVEWIYIDGPTPWHPHGELGDERERTDFEKTIAKDKPFVQWVETEGHRTEHERWLHIEESCSCIEEFLKEHAPIDVVVSYSFASDVLALYIERLRRAEQEVPWRLSVYFMGGYSLSPAMALDENRFLEPSEQPTLLITSDKEDTDPPRTAAIEANYSNLLVIKHEDGHFFPSSQPRAKEIYEQVRDHIKRHCGL